MCTVTLPLGDNPISVNKYIISYINFVTLMIFVTLASRRIKLREDDADASKHVGVLTILYIYIQGVPGGMCQTSGGCSLC